MRFYACPLIVLAFAAAAVELSAPRAKFQHPERVAACFDNHPAHAVEVLESVLPAEQLRAVEEALLPPLDNDAREAAWNRVKESLDALGIENDDTLRREVERRTSEEDARERGETFDEQ